MSQALRHGEAVAPAAVAPAAEAQGPRVEVYVWDLVVRITHWTIVASILLLAATGLYMAHPALLFPGIAGEHFTMGWFRVVHGYVAIAFSAAVLARIIWMFTGTRYARWTAFIPVQPARARGVFSTLAFYTFLRRKPPAFVGHNPVAGLTYVAIFGLYLVMILTGLVLFAPTAPAGSTLGGLAGLSAITWGLIGARWIHHVVMWLLLGFMVHHVYSAVLVSIVERNGTIDSIISGRKWFSPDELEEP